MSYNVFCFFSFFKNPPIYISRENAMKPITENQSGIYCQYSTIIKQVCVCVCLAGFQDGRWLSLITYPFSGLTFCPSSFFSSARLFAFLSSPSFTRSPRMQCLHCEQLTDKISRAGCPLSFCISASLSPCYWFAVVPLLPPTSDLHPSVSESNRFTFFFQIYSLMWKLKEFCVTVSIPPLHASCEALLWR